LLPLVLIRRRLRTGFPCAGRRPPQAEIFPQRLAGIILVEQPAALQFRHHMRDEIGIRARHVGRRDDKTVAAAAGEHFFQPVASSFGPPTIASWVWPRPEKVMKSRVLGLVLPDVLSTPSRMPSMPCMPCNSSDVSGSSMPLAAKSKFSPSASSDSASISSGSFPDQRHLVLGLGLGAPHTGVIRLQRNIWSGSRPALAASLRIAS
jgi:hypothetical protein